MLRFAFILIAFLQAAHLCAETPRNDVPVIPGPAVAEAANKTPPPLMPKLKTPLTAKDFQINQSGNNLEIVTPYGKKYIFGDPGFGNAHEYKIEIPLSEIQPPEPAPPPEGEKVAEEEKPKKKSKKSADDEEDEEDKEKEKVAKVANKEPQKVIVEYDTTDRLILEANRLYNRGKLYEATLVVEELLTKKPEYPRGWVMKGSLLFVQGHKDLAKAAWEKALTLDPNNTDVKNHLARLK